MLELDFFGIYKHCLVFLKETFIRSSFCDYYWNIQLTFLSHTETKDQWARDDPAFLVLLSIWLCGK